MKLSNVDKRVYWFLLIKCSQEAIAKVDQQVCESKKRLNAMRHQFKMKEKKLSGLQTEYNQMLKDSETISLADTGESDESRVSTLCITFFFFFSESGGARHSVVKNIHIFIILFVIFFFSEYSAQYSCKLRNDRIIM